MKTGDELHPSTRFKPGDIISWDLPHDGPVTVRLGQVGEHRITYTSSDGVTDAAESTFAFTLTWATRGWRAATEEEKTDFERRERPAPQNWE